MGDFFHGWRRKLGCVTLLMALVAMGGWVRSHSVEDFISFQSGANSFDGFLVSEHRIMWARWRWEDDVPNQTGEPLIRWSANRYSINPLMFFHRLRTKWYWHFCGFEYAGFGDRDDPMTQSAFWSMWAASYWSVIIPLTLISVFLLLTKPLKSNQKNSTEPIPAEGA